jgi:hypothetical protein
MVERIDGRKAVYAREVRFRFGNYEVSDIEAASHLEGLEEVQFWHPESADAWLSVIAKSASIDRVMVMSGNCTSAGAIDLLASKSPLSSLMLVGVSIDDKFMRRVANRDGLRSLYVDGKLISTDGLSELRHAKSLTHLHLSSGANLGGGFEKLADHPSLRSLDLHRDWFDEAELSALAKLKSIEKLRFVTARFPRGIVHAVAEMPRLKHLELDGAFAEGEDLADIKFAKLESYSTGEGGSLCEGLLTRLALCKSLSSLSAPRDRITESELAELAKVRQLDTLTIAGSPSKEAIKKFQQAQPYCVYIDGQWGVFQPRVGINLSKIHGSASSK